MTKYQLIKKSDSDMMIKVGDVFEIIETYFIHSNIPYARRISDGHLEHIILGNCQEIF